MALCGVFLEDAFARRNTKREKRPFVGHQAENSTNTSDDLWQWFATYGRVFLLQPCALLKSTSSRVHLARQRNYVCHRNNLLVAPISAAKFSQDEMARRSRFAA